MKQLMMGSVALAVLMALGGCNSSSNDNGSSSLTTDQSKKTNVVSTSDEGTQTEDEELLSDPCTDVNHPCKVTILHTNDTHGRFWHNTDGEYGMAAQKTLVDRLRAEANAAGSDVLVLSGGDVNTGVPESDLLKAEPDFIAMNKIGYDAMAVGNHEFDNPMSVLKKQEGWAQFPMLAANIYDKNTGKRVFSPYKVFKFENGLKIAIVGLTTEDTATISKQENVKDVDFRNPIQEADKLIKDIRANNEANMVLAITHMGHYANGANGSNAPGDVALARKLQPGMLDAIIGGHSQNPVCMEPSFVKYASFKPGDDCLPDQQNGTYIMQAYEWGKYVGHAEFSYVNGKLTLDKYELVPINLVKRDAKRNALKLADGSPDFYQPEIIKDPKLFETLQRYQDEGEKQLLVPVGDTDGLFMGERDVVRTQQTNLGRLITTATQTRLKADFGIVNSGGVRDSIPVGAITYRSVLQVQPFGNIVSWVHMNGTELPDYLAALATKTGGGYPQFSGLEMRVDCDIKKVDISKINGQDFDPTKQYSFAIPDFSAAGGDGYPNISAKTTNVGLVDAVVLKEYIAQHSPLSAVAYDPNAKDEVQFFAAGKQVPSCPAK